jgi:predicted dehydrogenase
MALRIGIIGCGEIAQYVGLFVRVTSGIQITACCDSSSAASTAFAGRFHVPKIYDSFCDLLADPQVDAAYIAAPHHLHFKMLLATIQAGKPALCEKPVTRTLAEGKEIARLAEAAGVKIGVNYQYRYDPGAYALAQSARRGALGRLLYARCNLPWRRMEDYFHKGEWRAHLATAGGGTLLTQGSHLLDLALWAMNNPPVAALGLTAHKRHEVEVEDFAQGIVELADGSQIEITSSMVAAREGGLSIEVYGEKATAVYSDRPWPHVRFSGASVQAPRLPVFGLHALHRSLKAFRDWVVKDRPFLIPAQDALPALAVVEGIYRSASSGCKEQLL